MRRFFALLLGLVLLSPTLSFAQTVARPSLWHVRGANADVYLLGSVHSCRTACNGVPRLSAMPSPAPMSLSLKCRRTKNPWRVCR